MRNFFLLVLLGLIVAGGYFYKKDPKACQVIVDDTVALFTQPTPSDSSTSATPAVSAADGGYNTAASTPAPIDPMAGNVLQNGKFSSGSAHWTGDGVASSGAGRGLVVRLSGNSWTQIAQDFKGDKGTRDTLTITYKASPDLSVSNTPEDFANVLPQIRFEGYENYGKVDLPVGDFLVWIGDLTNGGSRYERYPLLTHPPNHPQTIEHIFPPSLPFADKMVTLAFPPGSGSVVIVSVSVKSN